MSVKGNIRVFGGVICTLTLVILFTTSSTTVNSVGNTANNVVTAHTEARSTALVIGSTAGKLAQKLGAKPAGNFENNYDILIIGADQKADEATVNRIKTALGNGKEVVLDAPAPSSAATGYAKHILFAVTHFSVNAEAVLLQESPDKSGYLVTPIDSKTPAEAQSSALTTNGTTTAPASKNTAENIFDLKKGD